MRGDKECPFSGITKSGRVWRQVPESGAGSVASTRGMEQSNAELRSVSTVGYLAPYATKKNSRLILK